MLAGDSGSGQQYIQWSYEVDGGGLIATHITQLKRSYYSGNPICFDGKRLDWQLVKKILKLVNSLKDINTVALFFRKRDIHWSRNYKYQAAFSLQIFPRENIWYLELGLPTLRLAVLSGNKHVSIVQSFKTQKENRKFEAMTKYYATDFCRKFRC